MMTDLDVRQWLEPVVHDLDDHLNSLRHLRDAMPTTHHGFAPIARSVVDLGNTLRELEAVVNSLEIGT